MNGVISKLLSLQSLYMYSKREAPFNPREAKIGTILCVSVLVEKNWLKILFEPHPLNLHAYQVA